jgi:hypothetical protein
VSIATWPAGLFYEFSFNAPANQGLTPPWWTDLSARVLWAWKVQRGQQYELATNPTGMWNFALANSDGALDPENTAGPYYPDIQPYRGCRIRAMTGVNLLSVDQATAGEGTGFSGTIPARMHVVNDAGYPISIVASGSAHQGTQVYQAVLPSGAGAGTTVAVLQQVPVIPGYQYSFQAQARITAGNSVSSGVSVLWYDLSGTNISSPAGSPVTLTSGAGTWSELTVSGQAPSNAYSASLKIEIASGTLSASTTWQLDGLQWENSSTPTPWQMPHTLSANLLPRAIATGSASISLINDAVGNYWVTAGTSAGTLAQGQFLTPAPTGHTMALAWTTPAGTTSSNATLYAGNWLGQASVGPQPDCVQVTALKPYTGSWYTMRTTSADTTIQVTPAITWYSMAGAVISTSSGTAVTVPAGSWSSRVTVTGTAPAGAVWAVISETITTPATTTASNTIYHTGWQFEQASSASTWTDPGPTYFVFTGAVERWPQSWELSGTYGKLVAVGSDAFAQIAQDILPSPFVAEVLALGPNFFYQLADPAGSTSVADTSGNRVPAPIEISAVGAGSITLGTSVSAAVAGGGVLGSTGTCAAFANDPNQTPPLQFPETFVNIAKTSATPGPPTAGGWTRLISFQASAIPPTFDAYTLWMAYPPNSQSSVTLFFFMIGNTTGELALAVSNNTIGASYGGSVNICDGNWHQAGIVVNGTTFEIDFYVDGVQVATHTVAANPTPTGVSSDVLGAFIVYGANAAYSGLVGNLAHAIEFPVALTAAQIANLYNSWRTASTGDSTGQRAQRVLDWMGYTGAAAIENGATTDMGPATDIAGATAITVSTATLPAGVASQGGSGLQALNTITQTESGNCYVSGAGAITVTARTDRYDKTVPMFVFGEHDYLGEWPYEVAKTDFDPAHLYTGVEVTQYSTGQITAANSAAAAKLYASSRIQQLTMNQAQYTETQAAAAYLTGRYSVARQRIPNVTLHPSAVPGMINMCLQLEIGMRVRLMRRPNGGAPPITVDGFIESVAWALDPKTGSIKVTLQLSPADLSTYWTLAALHTTLTAQAASGQSHATIAALPDAAVNKLSQSLPVGYSLTFEPGTPRAETLALAAGGIPSTSLGYTSATLNFATNFAFTHAAGSIVCEPLPAGYTDPTTWDASSVLGAAYTTVASGGGSGTNTITVNPLADSKVNALGQNWNVGDTIWLSPGTSNFEAATISSVATTFPNYTSCQITLSANLAHNHSAGDYVCDPLPAGVTNPTTVAATTRLAY